MTSSVLRFVPQGTGYLNRKMLEVDNGLVDLKDFSKNMTQQFSEIDISYAGYPAIIKCRPHKEIKDKCSAGIEFVHILPNSKIIPCPSFKWLKSDCRYSLSLQGINRLGLWRTTKRNDCWQKEVRSSNR